MPRPRPRLRERRSPFNPFGEGSGREKLLQHLGGHDYLGEAYGDPAFDNNFDRGRMQFDWEQHRDAILEAGEALFPHIERPYWSEREFDGVELEEEDGEEESEVYS